MPGLALPIKPAADNGIAAAFLIDLAAYLDPPGIQKSPYRAVAERALTGVGSEQRITAEGRFVGDYALALDKLLAGPLTFSVVTAEGSAGSRALYQSAVQVYAPRKILRIERPGHYPDLGKPALYVCGNSLCSQPFFAADRLAEGVAAFRKRLP